LGEGFALLSDTEMPRFLLPIATLFLTGCATLPSVSAVNTIADGLVGPVVPSAMSPVDLRNLQLRRYQVPKEVAFAATMTALMDAGYRIQNADISTGLIIAGASSADKVQLDLRGLVVTREAPIASVFIEELSDGSSVRTSFALGQATTGIAGNGERMVQDPKLYESFFVRLDAEIIERKAQNNGNIAEFSASGEAGDPVEPPKQ
jgi:hypothetical protein